MHRVMNRFYVHRTVKNSPFLADCRPRGGKGQRRYWAAVPLTITANGKSDYVILPHAQANETERYAAAEAEIEALGDEIAQPVNLHANDGMTLKHGCGYQVHWDDDL